MENMCTHISFASNNSVLDKMFFPFVQVGTCCQDHIKNTNVMFGRRTLKTLY